MGTGFGGLAVLVGAFRWYLSVWSLMHGRGTAAIWGFPARNFLIQFSNFGKRGKLVLNNLFTQLAVIPIYLGCFQYYQRLQLKLVSISLLGTTSLYHIFSVLYYML